MYASVFRTSPNLGKIFWPALNLTKGDLFRHYVRVAPHILPALEDRGNRYVADVHEALKPVAVASRSNKVIGDRMILNAAFLVERAHERSFDEKVKDISRRYEEMLTLKYTGPWPPYNYVNIKLKLEKAD